MMQPQSFEIWATAISDDDDWNYSDEEERRKAESFKHRGDQNRFLAGRRLLREAIAKIAEIEPDEICFTYDDRGKCRILEPSHLPPLDFSISHSGEAAVALITHGERCGVDIEPLNPRILQHPIDIVFSKRELETLKNLPPSQKWREALRLWTGKEAYSKLLGLGAHIDFATLDLSELPDDIDLQTQIISLDEKDYLLSVAVER